MSSGSDDASDRRRQQLYSQSSVPASTVDSIKKAEQKAEQEHAERERAEREAQWAQAMYKLEGGTEQSVGEPIHDSVDDPRTLALSALEGRSAMSTTDAPKTQGPAGQVPT